MFGRITKSAIGCVGWTLNRIITLILICVPMLSFSDAGLSAPANLVAWWPADNHTYDVVATNKAVLQVGATYASGKVGEAFSLPGGTAKVYINEWPNTDLSGMPEWTIEAWVNPDLASSGTYPIIYSEGNRVATLGITPTGYLDSWVNAGNQLISTDPIAPDDWTHVALVFNGTERLFFINGNPAGGDTSPPPNWTPYAGSAIGNSISANPLYAFAGEVDELSLYDRALSQSEIADIHTAGTAGKYLDGPEPEFIVEPQSQTNFLGETISFEAVVMGVPRPTYQWHKDGTPLTGETNRTLVLTHLDFADDGDYYMVAENMNGSFLSAPATLTVRFCAETPSGLVAWWPGDGSGLDATGNHHGAVWGNTTYPAGVVNNAPAFGFNGSDAYVAVPDAPELSPHVGTNGEMSVEAWVYISQFPSSTRIILRKGDPGSSEYSLQVSATGVPAFYMATASEPTWVGAVGGQLVLNTWHHLVGTFKRGDAVRIYQDTVLQAENTNAVPDSLDGSSTLYIGRNSQGHFFDGRVDEVAIYDRALNIDEITKLYDGREFGKCYGATNPAPVFVVQPSQQSGYLLLNAGMSALAAGTPRPDYQWYRSIDSEWIEQTGQTNATLGFSDLGEENEGYYMVSASNMHGVAYSDSAFLEVLAHDILTGGDDFEKGWNGWTTDDYSLWQVGRPTYGPPVINGERAHSGANCAATVLGGKYPYGSDKRLITPPMDLPEIENWEELVLSFWQWFHYYSGYWDDGCNSGWGANDYGKTQIQLYNTNTLAWSSWVDLMSVTRHSAVWAPAQVDLTEYAGGRVRIAFFHVDNMEDPSSCYGTHHYESAGWHIDDVKIEKRPTALFADFEGFEDGWNGWHTEMGVWEVGLHSGSYEGANCAGTVIGDNYPFATDSRLVSPIIEVPAKAQNELVLLEFWHWFSYWYAYWDDGCNAGWGGNDKGYVQVQSYNSNTLEWSGWSTLLTISRYSGTWVPAQVDLSAYAGKRIRIGFYHTDATEDTSSCYSTHHYESTGWYVDSLRLFKEPVMTFTESASFDFEDGWGGWHADGGIWQVGQPTSGPLSAHSGAACVATKLGGNYPWETDSRLMSPEIDMPDVAAGEELVLRFWEWFSYWYGYRNDGCNAVWGGNDKGYVQIQTFNTNTVSWSSWTTLHTVSRSSAGWAPGQVDLTAYAGMRVRFAFYHVDGTEDTSNCYGTHHYQSSGWYLDDIVVEKRPIITFSQPQVFESGWDGWYANHGIWQVGIPSSGPAIAHSGVTCAGTTLSGNYPWETDSSLISPPIDVPDVVSVEPVVLKFWQWFDYWSGNYDDGCNSGFSEVDHGEVYIQVLDPLTLNWSSWTNEATYRRTSAAWTSTEIDLSNYTGKRIRVAFSHYDATEDTSNCYGIHHYEDPGWYIDDVFVKRGNISIVPIANQTINEVNSFGLPSTLTFDVNVVGTDPGACLGFQLIEPPAGASINPITGQFTWTPSECQGAGVYRIPIYVVDYCNGEANDMAVVQITVNEVNEAPRLMAATGSAYVGQTNAISMHACDPDLPVNTLTYSLLGTVPNGLSINSSSGVLSWVPTVDQVGDYALSVRVGDSGSPKYWATNTVSIGVTTNAPNYLDIEEVAEGIFEFTILNGRDDFDYKLQRTFELHRCPYQTTWEDVMLVSPTSVPPQFIYSPPDFPTNSMMFFRVQEMPRTP